MMRKTGHRLVFHLVIIHGNNCCVVKMLLCPLYLRMQCPESTCFCNKRCFMWVFVKAVSYRAKGCSRARPAGGASAYPPPTLFAFPLMARARTPPQPAWGGPRTCFAISAAFTGAALPAFPGSSARIASALLLRLLFGGDRLETLVHAPRRWPTRRRACAERGTGRHLRLAGAAWPGFRPGGVP